MFAFIRLKISINVFFSREILIKLFCHATGRKYYRRTDRQLFQAIVADMKNLIYG